MLAHGPLLGFPHLYDDFHHVPEKRARKRAKSANVLVFFGEQFIYVRVHTEHAKLMYPKIQAF